MFSFFPYGMSILTLRFVVDMLPFEIDPVILISFPMPSNFILFAYLKVFFIRWFFDGGGFSLL